MLPINRSSVNTRYTDEYQLLVSHEDDQHNLTAAMDALQPMQGCLVVEFGAGTGRVTGLLSSRTRLVHAFDLTQPMLRVAQE